MLRAILDAGLTKHQREAGLRLEENEDFLYLIDSKGRIQAVFSATSATIEAIRAEAERALDFL